MKEFNYTGTCIPSKHYMVDTSNKITKVIDLINRGKYFIINRPRQYGKTTTMYLVVQELLKTEEYLPIKISFEGVGDEFFKTEGRFCSGFLNLLSRDPVVKRFGYSQLFYSEIEKTKDIESLTETLTDILSKIKQKTVLMIDEVDRATNFEVMFYFLGMLRNKYLEINEGRGCTFQSVVLAGLHDIKTLKAKIRPESQSSYNSPWNIAVDFDVDMSFNPQEIETMLRQYVNETGTQMNTTELSNRLHFWTSGYPFMVSKLCYIIDAKLKPKDNDNCQLSIVNCTAWEFTDIDKAVDIFSN